MEKNKKIMAWHLGLQQREVDSLTGKIKQPVSLNEAFLLVEDMVSSHF